MFQRPLTLILLKKYRDTNGRCIVNKLVAYTLLSANGRAYFCSKSIAIEMGGVPRYFSNISGSGADVALLSPDLFLKMGSQHPSPDVKTLCNFEPLIWPEIITSRDAESACFKGSRTSCREIIFGILSQKFGQKRSHHVMDASCRKN